MASAVIICKGEFPKREYPLYLIRSADYIICCDGAAATYDRRQGKIFGHERKPDAVIGDLDSISPAMKRRYALTRYDDIDSIHILGAGGMREDHTVGNLSYLMEYAKELDGLKERVILDGINIRPELYIDMVSDWTTAFAITDSFSFHVGEGREISIFSADNALKIKSEGLTWKTDDVVFDNWWKATLNKACADEVRLTLSHPSAVLIILN